MCRKDIERGEIKQKSKQTRITGKYGKLDRKMGDKKRKSRGGDGASMCSLDQAQKSQNSQEKMLNKILKRTVRIKLITFGKLSRDLEARNKIKSCKVACIAEIRTVEKNLSPKMQMAESQTDGKELK